MMRFLISFKHRHPKAWALVEEVNGFLFRLRYGRKTGKVKQRKSARSIAKARMQRTGIQHINRNFSMNWKRYI